MFLSPTLYNPIVHLQKREKIKVGWLVVFNVPSTARSFRDSAPIYCPLRRTRDNQKFFDNH